LATITRSIGSSSSAVRRSTVLRSPTSTIRARLPSLPDTSPTTRTRSPTTTPLRPRGRAFIAITRRPSTSRVNLPRSTVMTVPSTASS
jgi:hypothetical protein